MRLKTFFLLLLMAIAGIPAWGQVVENPYVLLNDTYEDNEYTYSVFYGCDGFGIFCASESKIIGFKNIPGITDGAMLRSRMLHFVNWKGNYPGDYPVTNIYIHDNPELISVEIPDWLKEIGHEAGQSPCFVNCPNLTSVDFPTSIKDFNSGIFRQCLNIKDIYVHWDSGSGLPRTNYPVTTAKHLFIGSYENVKFDVSTVNLHVPKGSAALYRSSPYWKAFNIVEEGETLLLSVDKESLDFTSAGEQKTFTITSNTSWTVEKDASWLTVSPASGSNNGTVNVTAAANTSTSVRTATITVSGTGMSSQTISITQASPSSGPCTNPTASGTTGPLSWTLCPDGTFTLSGTGAAPSTHTADETPWYNYRYNITSAVINNGVTEVGSFFNGCSNLVSATIPNTVTSIKVAAFQLCEQLSSITIPNSVTSIYSYAFWYCNSLTSVAIPASVSLIASQAFGMCSNLSAINVNTGNMAYSSDGGILYSKDKTLLHTYPKGKDGSTFSIPSSVASIYPAAFQGNAQLTSVTIPNCVSSIGELAFNACNNLTDLTVAWTTPLTIPDNTFADVNIAACTLHVPAGTEALYKAAPVWKNFRYSTASLSVSPDSLKFTAAGEQKTFAVTSNTSWTVSKDATWLTVSPTSGSNNGTVNVTAVANTSTSARTATITVSGTGVSSQTVSIGQAGTSSVNNDFTFEVRNNEAVITGYTGAGGAVTILPVANINGQDYPVRIIGYAAFNGKGEITSLTIPNSVTTIESSAFWNCTGLTSIAIPASVTSIIASVFGGCSSLAFINVDAASLTYSSVEGVLYDKNKTTLLRYPQGKSGSSFTIPASVKTIGNDCFLHCSQLTGITIPGSVSSIGETAFWDCSISSVTISSAVTFIGRGAFGACRNLPAINVSADNPAYSSEDGVLYSKDKTALLIYPLNKSGNTFVIANTVTLIEAWAFSHCRLTSVTIPSSVNAIGYRAFQECTSLENLTVAWNTPLSLSANNYIFDNVKSSCVLHVPSGSKARYQSAPVWQQFSNMAEYALPTGTEGIDAALKVSLRNHILYVGSTATETIEVYSFDGKRIFSTKKEAGEATFTVPTAQKAVIVRGSSGWTLKAINN